MNIIIEYFKNKDFTLRSSQGVQSGDGIIDNYHVNFVYNKQAFLIVAFDFYLQDQIQLNNLNEELKAYNNRTQKLEISKELLGLSIYGINKKVIIEKLDILIPTIIKLLNKYEAKGYEYCPHCGRLHDETSVFTNNVIRERLHKECYDLLNNKNDLEKEKNKQAYLDQPVNFAKGFLGLLLASILGLVLNMALFRLGFLVGVIQIFITFSLGIKLYVRFGGKINYLMLYSTIIVSILMSALSILLNYGIAGIIYFKEEESVTYNLFTAFLNYIKYPQIQRDLLIDIIITSVFLIMYIVFEILQVRRMIQGLMEGYYIIGNNKKVVAANDNDEINNDINEENVDIKESNSSLTNETKENDNEINYNRYRYEEDEEIEQKEEK